MYIITFDIFILTQTTIVQDMKLNEPLDVQSMDENWVNKRWPTRIFYGEKGQLMHPYTRIQTPNLKLMN